MKYNSTAGLVVMAMTTTCLVGCGWVVSKASAERASWSYVDDAWGGLAVDQLVGSPDNPTLRFKTKLHGAKRMDSAICVCGGSVRVQGQRLIVSLNRCLCDSATATSAELPLPRLASGSYSVVYDDESAGFPVVGRVDVP